MILFSFGTSYSFGISLGCGTSGGGGGGIPTSSSSDNFGGGAFNTTFGTASLFTFGCGGTLNAGTFSSPLFTLGRAIGVIEATLGLARFSFLLRTISLSSCLVISRSLLLRLLLL